MAKFRKKPVVVDAVRWLGDEVHLRGFLRADDPVEIIYPGRIVCITTLEGKMECPLGHWLIRGVKGELYPCDPEIFEMTYVPGH